MEDTCFYNLAASHIAEAWKYMIIDFSYQTLNFMF